MNAERNDSGDNWFLWLVLWPVLTALMGSGLTYWLLQQQRQEDLSLRPPIVVMDVGEWIRVAGAGATDAERFANGGERAEAAAAKLKDQGVLVLDSRIVRAAPEQAYVTTPKQEAARD